MVIFVCTLHFFFFWLLLFVRSFVYFASNQLPVRQFVLLDFSFRKSALTSKGLETTNEDAKRDTEILKQMIRYSCNIEFI